METSEHVAALRAEGSLLALAADRAGPDAPVPSCPGWCVRDVLIHTGYVHRWATGYVIGEPLTWMEQATEAEMLNARPVGDQQLPGWFRARPGIRQEALVPADQGWTMVQAARGL